MMSDVIPPGTDELFLLFLHRDLLLAAVTSHLLADRTQSLKTLSATLVKVMGSLKQMMKILLR